MASYWFALYKKPQNTVFSRTEGVVTLICHFVLGLTYYAEVLCRLFKACEFLITVPLNDDNPKQSNVDYIYEYIANIFVQHFTNLTE